MPQGLEIFNASGQLMVGLTTRAGKFLGSEVIPVGTGSKTVAEVTKLGGRLFAFSLPYDETLSSPVVNATRRLDVSVSGNVISWAPGGDWRAGAPQGSRILYWGVY